MTADTTAASSWSLDLTDNEDMMIFGLVLTICIISGTYIITVITLCCLWRRYEKLRRAEKWLTDKEGCEAAKGKHTYEQIDYSESGEMIRMSQQNTANADSLPEEEVYPGETVYAAMNQQMTNSPSQAETKHVYSEIDLTRSKPEGSLTQKREYQSMEVKKESTRKYANMVDCNEDKKGTTVRNGNLDADGYTTPDCFLKD